VRGWGRACGPAIMINREHDSQLRRRGFHARTTSLFTAVLITILPVTVGVIIAGVAKIFCPTASAWAAAITITAEGARARLVRDPEKFEKKEETKSEIRENTDFGNIATKRETQNSRQLLNLIQLSWRR